MIEDFNVSDFLFSSQGASSGELISALASIYNSEPPKCVEFYGAWGSLAVTQSQYRGFDPLETDTHIVVIIGGPVLCFQDNDFMSGGNSQAGTRAIYTRWLTGHIDWGEDLSGPFVVLLIDKVTCEIMCVTDLMMFIPLYQHESEVSVAISTHVDALASHCGQSNSFDEVSLVDFILHNVVTYPYTIYKKIFQCHPAAEHRYTFKEGASSIAAAMPVPYWLPTEADSYESLSEAAKALRSGVNNYVERITGSMHHVAQFISAGEDSRVVSGVLPIRLQRDAFVFLDKMNREGRVAKKVARIYGANFTADYRELTHYLAILPEAAALIGGGHQCKHSHALGFHARHKLDGYSAVFGGYLSDSLLKALYARKPKGFDRFPFLPQVELPGETRSKAVANPLFSDELLNGVTQRRRAHLRVLQSLRPSTAHEWFALWPMTMRATIPNLYSNRRLFASFEPFMSKEVVKIGASVPVSWKLNRRLFNKAFRPFLSKSKWCLHPDGQLPYFPWWVNSPIRLLIWSYRQVVSCAGRVRVNQGPWADWQKIQKTNEWQAAINATLDSGELVGLQQALQRGALTGSKLGVHQKINFLQVLNLVNKKTQKQPETQVTMNESSVKHRQTSV